MLRIGLTGGIGSGKTTVSNRFSALGVPVIDTDIIARELVDHDPEILQSIVRTFGNQVLQADGSLNRQKLAEIVFSDQDNRRRLEAILHPQIRRVALQRADELETSGSPYTIIVVPLLFETDFHQLVDRSVVVTADVERRCQRVSDRDHRPMDEIRAIMSQQLDDESRRQRADDIIENDSDLDSLEDRVQELHRHYLTMARNQDQD